MRNCSVKDAAHTIVRAVGDQGLYNNCSLKLRFNSWLKNARTIIHLLLVCSLLVMLLVQPALQAGDLFPFKGVKTKASPAKVLQVGNHVEVDVRPMSEKMKQKKVKVLKQGTSSTAARKAAIAALPFDKLDEQERAVVKRIIESSGMFRALPTLEFECEPKVYQFFIANPDVACSIWRSMKISKLEMWQTGRDEYETDLKDGTLGAIEIYKRGDTSNLVLCNGEFKSPLLLKPIKAVGVVHVQSKYAINKSGRRVVLHTGHLFVSFPSQTVETAAKIISPVSNMMMDRNFREITLFTYMMSQAMKHQPGWVERTAKTLEGVLEVRQQQLIKVTANVYLDHRKEQLGRAGKKDVSLDDILRPLRQTSALLE